MFGGFDPRFLAEASNVKVGITKKLQSHIGDQIIKVEKGLSIIRPPLEHEVREAEVEEKPKTREHCECQKERKHKEGEGEEEVVQEKEIRKRKHHIGEHEGCGECENKEEEEQSRSRERGEWHEHKGQQHGKEKGRERYKEGGEGRERSNVLEEILCTLKLHENIADPSHADIFNPRAGRVRTINSLTMSNSPFACSFYFSFLSCHDSLSIYPPCILSVFCTILYILILNKRRICVVAVVFPTLLQTRHSFPTGAQKFFLSVFQRFVINK